MPFRFQRVDIPDVILVGPKVFSDDRGFFMEVYKDEDFAKFDIKRNFVQINYSKSVKNVLRGLHYQKEPMAQGKLIGVMQGEIFDVVVDLRKDSPFHGHWSGITLDDKRRNMLYVPEGFAHGFCVLSGEAEIIYYCTKAYSFEHECGILWNDPALNIEWPIANPVLSDKDQSNPLFKDADKNFIYQEK